MRFPSNARESMCRERFVFVTSALLAVGTAPVTEAAEARLQVGAADGPNAVFIFDRTAKPHAIVLRTTQVGVAGSRFEVTIDRAKKPALSRRRM